VREARIGRPCIPVVTFPPKQIEASNKLDSAAIEALVGCRHSWPAQGLGAAQQLNPVLPHPYLFKSSEKQVRIIDSIHLIDSIHRINLHFA